MPKKRMKDMRVMSGTKSQVLPTNSPPYFKHSFFDSEDQLAFKRCTIDTKTYDQNIKSTGVVICIISTQTYSNLNPRHTFKVE